MSAPVRAPLDQPRAVRSGEDLDAEAIGRWATGRVTGARGTPSIQQFPSGASNLTYLLKWPDLELVLRRPPVGTRAASAHDMGREVRMLQALGPRYPYVPEVVATCEDPEVVGAGFYLMRRIEGIILRQELPAELGLDAPSTRRLCKSVLEKLVELHQVDVTGLEALGKGPGYVERQIAGWTRRWRAALTEDAADFDPVISWLEANGRADVATTVVHGDFRLDNVVLDPADPTRVVGVLDWEMSTLGDPLMDLGNSLAYWVQADDDMVSQLMRRQPTHEPGMLSRAEVVAWYGEEMGWDLSDFVFYEVYGLFRLAVIIQQIYLRYSLGQTKDPRFAPFGHLAHHLAGRCQALIEGRR